MFLVRHFQLRLVLMFFLMLNCATQIAHAGETGGCDSVTTYESGFRGVLPPEADNWNHQHYKVIGEQDGLKSWLIRYDDHLYRGGELENADGARSLADLGIKTVFAITSADKERQWLESVGIKVVDLSFDKNASLSEQQIEQIAEQLSTSSAPAYVHCVGGTQRGGMVGVIYRLTQDWQPDQALLEFAYLGGSLKDNSETLKSVLQTLAPNYTSSADSTNSCEGKASH